LLFENYALGRCGLTATAGQEWLTVQFVEFLKPFRRELNQGLQENALRDSPDAYAVPCKTKFSGKAHGLAASVLKQFGDLGLRHLELLVHYLASIYQ
jgi:hypothetical protein